MQGLEVLPDHDELRPHRERAVPTMTRRHRVTRTAGLAIAAALVMAAGTAAIRASAAGGGRASGHEPRTLVSTSDNIRLFAQDGNYLAWITEGGRCGFRLHLRELRTGRTRTIDGVGCSGEDREGLWSDELALASGRALWTADAHGSNQQIGIRYQTASFTDRRVRTLSCCDLYVDESHDDVPEFPIAGQGGLLIYYSHSDANGGGHERAVRRVVGGNSRKLFDVERPVGLAVHGAHIALAKFGEVRRGEGCGCHFDPVWSPDGRRIAFLRSDGPRSQGELDYDVPIPAEIAVMNADGTGLATLTSDRRAGERSQTGSSVLSTGRPTADVSFSRARETT
jgi:WD40-like Beta Propeller Repeat